METKTKTVEVALGNGLCRIDRASGVSAFVMRYRLPVNGVRKKQKYTLLSIKPKTPGRFTKKDMDRVERAAAVVRGTLAVHQDPNAEKRAERNAIGREVGRLFREFITTPRATRRGTTIRRSSVKHIAGILGYNFEGEKLVESGNGVLSHWKGRSVESITDKDIKALIAEIAVDRPVRAKRTLTTLKTFWKRHLEKPFPAVFVNTPGENRRSRTLINGKDFSELCAVYKAAATMPYPEGPLARLLILTGTRLNETKHAKWPEFSRDEHGEWFWTIPGEQTKNGLTLVMPLSPEAVAVLNDCHMMEGKAGFVFTLDGARPCGEPTRWVNRLRKLSGTDVATEEKPLWTCHDLRRTFRTGLASLKVPYEVAEACVNHVRTGVNGIYNQWEYIDEKREAVNKWAKLLSDVVDGKTGGRVVAGPWKNASA
jgi:integrase